MLGLHAAQQMGLLFRRQLAQLLRKRRTVFILQFLRAQRERRQCKKKNDDEDDLSEFKRPVIRKPGLAYKFWVLDVRYFSTKGLVNLS